jgi:hypothetical protein
LGAVWSRISKTPISVTLKEFAAGRFCLHCSYRKRCRPLVGAKEQGARIGHTRGRAPVAVLSWAPRMRASVGSGLRANKRGRLARREAVPWGAPQTLRGALPLASQTAPCTREVHASPGFTAEVGISPPAVSRSHSSPGASPFAVSAANAAEERNPAHPRAPEVRVRDAVVERGDKLSEDFDWNHGLDRRDAVRKTGDRPFSIWSFFEVSGHRL